MPRPAGRRPAGTRPVATLRTPWPSDQMPVSGMRSSACVGGYRCGQFVEYVIHRTTSDIPVSTSVVMTVVDQSWTSRGPVVVWGRRGQSGVGRRWSCRRRSSLRRRSSSSRRSSLDDACGVDMWRGAYMDIYIPRRYVYTWPPGRRGGAAGRVPSSPSASSCVKSFTTTTHIRQYTIL